MSASACFYNIRTLRQCVDIPRGQTDKDNPAEYGYIRNWKIVKLETQA